MEETIKSKFAGSFKDKLDLGETMKVTPVRLHFRQGVDIKPCKVTKSPPWNFIFRKRQKEK